MGQKRGKHQVDDVRLERTAAAGGGENGHIVLIAHQKKISGFDGGEKALNTATDFFHGAPDNIVRSGGRGGGGHNHSRGFGAKELLQGARNMLFVFQDNHICRRPDAEFFELLANYRFEQGLGAVARNGVAIQYRDVRLANRARLHDRTPVLKHIHKSVEIGLGDGERRALDGCDSLTGAGEAEIRNSGDDDGRSNVDLAQKVVIDQNAAVFRGGEIGPTAWSKIDFGASAGHFARNGANRGVFGNFTFFQFRNPDLGHAFDFEDADVLIPQDVAFG